MAMEDNYGDGEVATQNPPTTNESEPTPKSTEEEGDGKTALIPKDVCPGMEPGDEITFRIVRAMDDQYEVSYEDSSTDKSETPVEAPAPKMGMEGYD